MALALCAALWGGAAWAQDDEEPAKPPKEEVAAPPDKPAGDSAETAKPQTKSRARKSETVAERSAEHPEQPPVDYFSLLFVFVLATLIGLGVVARVSRLLHTPLMSLTNAISAIAVVGSIIITGEDYPLVIRLFGFVALFASMTNVVSGFLITDRMLRMFKQKRTEAKR
jgi:NAD(P) transhydrogenase subunit alpha